jgi:hypothetical protein
MPLQIAVPVGVPFNALEFLDELIMSKDGDFRLSSPHGKTGGYNWSNAQLCICTPWATRLARKRRYTSCPPATKPFSCCSGGDASTTKIQCSCCCCCCRASGSIQCHFRKPVYPSHLRAVVMFLPLRRGRLLNRFQKYSSIGAEQGGEKRPEKGRVGLRPRQSSCLVLA